MAGRPIRCRSRSCAGAPTSWSPWIFPARRRTSGATSPIPGSACSPPCWSWATPSPPRKSSTARPTSACGRGSAPSALSTSCRRARSCGLRSRSRPSSRRNWRHCWRARARSCEGSQHERRTRSAPSPRCRGARECTEPTSTYVAALGILERGAAEIDPIGGGEIADRHRLVLLQRHQEHVPVLGRFAARKCHVRDAAALADAGLARLLRVLEDSPGPGYERGSGERAQFLHESLLESIIGGRP